MSGYVDRPDYDEDGLETTAGYVDRLWVEQENDRDQVAFRLCEYHTNFGTVGVSSTTNRYCIYLDVGTTVALAQFQLLRDALQNKTMVVIDYLPGDDDDSNNYVYLVLLRQSDDYPVTVEEIVHPEWF